MILMDNWQGTDMISATLEGNQTKTVSRNSRLTNSKVCGNNGDDQEYLRFDQNYIHNSSTTFDVTITTTSPNSKWGVKQFIVLARLCNMYCASCFGAQINRCYSCVSEPIMMLSGTTCNETCLPGYGMTFDNTYCVFCDLKCTICFELSYNCSACKTNGTYASFLLPYNFSCEITCPVGMYGNYTDRTCYPCDGGCVSCRSTPTYCY